MQLLEGLQEQCIKENPHHDKDLVKDFFNLMVSSGMLARVAWKLYDELDYASDFPIIKFKVLFIKITITKERCEPALKWLLTKLVGERKYA